MRRTALAIAVLAALLAVPTPAAAQSRSCAGINAVVLSIGAQVTRLTATHTDCGTARNTARQWLSGLSRRDAFVECVPPYGSPSETCKIGRYSCRATGIPGSPVVGDDLRCHYGSRRISWRAQFNMEPQGDWEEL